MSNNDNKRGVVSDFNLELGFDAENEIQTVYRLKDGFFDYETKEEALKAITDRHLIKKGRDELNVFLKYLEDDKTSKIILGAYVKDDNFMAAYNHLKSVVEREELEEKDRIINELKAKLNEHDALAKAT